MAAVTAHIRPDLDAIPAYIPGRSFPGAIKLASNETTQGPLPSVHAAIAEAVGGVNRYPDIRATALVESLAKKLGVATENVAAGNGSVALCQEVVQITCGPGDEVLFAWRSFEAYPIITRVAGATPVQVPLTADHVHDLDAMLAAITDRTRLIFVCNPNNPTGTVVRRAELEAFLDAVPSNILVVLDEAYFEYTRPPLTAITSTASNCARPPQRDRAAHLLEGVRPRRLARGLRGGGPGHHHGPRQGAHRVRRQHYRAGRRGRFPGGSGGTTGPHRRRHRRADASARRTGRAGFDVPESSANFVWLPLGELSPGFAAASTEQGMLSAIRRRGRADHHRRPARERRVPRFREHRRREAGCGHRHHRVTLDT